MMLRPFAMALMLAVCGALTACTLNNNTALPPAPNNPPPVVDSDTVPAADANETGPVHTPAGGGPAYRWDISSMESQRIGPPGTTYTELVVSTTFEHPDGTPDNLAFAALPAPGTSNGLNSLVGVIGINIGATTTASFQCGTDHYSNISFLVNLGAGAPFGPRLADGNAAILDTTLTQVGEAQISGGASVVTVTIPISAVGGSSSGPFNIVGAWGTNTIQNDCAPNGIYLPDSSERIPMSAVGGGAPLGIPLGLGIYMH